MANPGMYRKKITILRRESYTKDKIGNRKAETATYLECYAYINNLSGKEYWEAAQAKAEDTVMFTVRSCAKIRAMNTTEYFISWNGKEYNITSIDDVQYKGEQVKFRATAKR